MGLLGLKMKFNPHGKPSKCALFGFLKGHKSVVQEFTGPNCEHELVMWLLLNVVDYNKDARRDSRIVHIFTRRQGGCRKEIKSIFHALVQIAGRDSRMIGEFEKPKKAEFENIRFLDLGSYLDNDALVPPIH